MAKFLIQNGTLEMKLGSIEHKELFSKLTQKLPKSLIISNRQLLERQLYQRLRQRQRAASPRVDAKNAFKFPKIFSQSLRALALKSVWIPSLPIDYLRSP
ncbi:MAG: hypothetical protein V7K21_07820 [Nostoc sp.]|uniref:hypothetical protein n=1 Tax=Nostoc sp. TaxID=1180 RepID=UPI002FFA469C